MSSQTFKAGLLCTALLLLALMLAHFAGALPEGPAVTTLGNETKAAAAAAMINTSGGSITTIRLNATQQNPRWKAFLGNVSGTLVLDDAAASSIYQWSLAAVSGEVYATRKETTVSWANISCANTTHISNEELNMSHTNANDNISRTFSVKNHTSFYVGTTSISENACYSIHTFVNDTNQTQFFQEVILYDGNNATNGMLVYATTLESDKPGFDNMTYDFQLILPENGGATWTGATPYYFYAELT